jgi:hypothetical protein
MAAIATTSYIFWKGTGIGWDILLILIPAGLMTDGLIHSYFIVNHSRKAPSKTRAIIYGFDVLFPFIWTAAFTIAGLMPVATIAIFLSLAIAIGCTKTMMHSIEGGFAMIGDMDQRTSNLQSIFLVLLSLAFIVEKFV